MADEEIFEIEDEEDIDDEGLPRSQFEVETGDVDTILNNILLGKVPFSDVRRLLANSTTVNLRPVRPRPHPKPSGGGVNSPYFQSSSFHNGTHSPFRFQFQNYGKLLRPVRFHAKSKETPAHGMVVLPVPPETIEVSGSNAPEEITSAAGIIFSHAGPFAPMTYTFEGIFPFVQDIHNVPTFVPEDTIHAGFYNPPALCAKFTTAMRAGQPVRFNILRPGSAEKLMTERVVVITDFSWSFKMGHGKDRFFTMTLREWFPQHLVMAGHKKRRAQTGNGGHGGNGGNTKPPSGGTYVIKPGDSLWKISDRYTGDGRKWPELYKLNKKKLNDELKKRGQKLNNPHLIYPGVSIKIPPSFKR